MRTFTNSFLLLLLLVSGAIAQAPPVDPDDLTYAMASATHFCPYKTMPNTEADLLHRTIAEGKAEQRFLDMLTGLELNAPAGMQLQVFRVPGYRYETTIVSADGRRLNWKAIIDFVYWYEPVGTPGGGGPVGPPVGN